ncbi:MAG: gliding motility-associated C-terminal domain-containing protein, partial [Elusimicrobia bacterium]|nr:gliding motility-associated C-terminal domain-containing protein [Elusimicrobiota bacterium]
PDLETYVYMGSKVLPGIPNAQYKTRLRFHVVNLGSDYMAPALALVPLKKPQYRVKERLTIKAEIQEDVDLKYVRLYHRYKGEPSYQVSSMTVTQDKTNPMRYFAEHRYPPESMRIGTLEYYSEAGDGSNTTTLDKIESVEILSEHATISKVASGEPEKFVVSEGNSDGNLTQLNIPAGSVPKGTVLTARNLPTSSLPAKENQAVNVAVEFGPSGLLFNRPITMEIGYSDEDGDGLVDGTNINERNLRIFWYDGFEWRNLGGTVNVASNTVSVPISHFSVYGLFPAGDPTAEEVRPKEKIITPNGDGVNDLAQFGVSGSYEIKIFNMFGREIKNLVNVSVWNGKNEDGETVESGVYLYQVKTPNFRVSGVIGVAR